MLTYWETLAAIQSNVPVNDSYAKLWGRKAQGNYTVVTYIGTLPAVLTDTKAGYLHKYKIYGNTEQTGTPTPENPIVPQECGERTENLFDVEPRMLDASNWTMAGSNFAYFMYYLLSENTVNRLKRIGTIAGTVYLIAGGTYFNSVVLAITSSIKATGISTEERLLQNDGTPMQYSADVSGYSDIYLCIGYGSGITPSNKQMFIDFIFDNYNIMLNAGTVPLPYIPYGYKLPLTSAGQDVDIYIGDDTLSTDEYVDSGTGKIYRMVSGTLTPVDPPVPFPQIPTSAGSTTLSWAGEGLAPSKVELKYERKR